MSISSSSARDRELSTLGYWLHKLKRPLCQHDFRVIGYADDRYLGQCEVVRCSHCGALERVVLRPGEVTGLTHYSGDTRVTGGSGARAAWPGA